MRFPITILAILLLTSASASPQSSGPSAGTPLEVHGSFRRLAHTGDTSAKVALDAIRIGPGVWGVGALAGLTGEIIVVDGRVLVSRGSDPQGRTSPARASDAAVLYAGAVVESWHERIVPKAMTRAAFERFVEASAREIGLPPDAPFALRVEGVLPSLTWHVVTGQPASAAATLGHGAGHGGSHANKHAGMHVHQEQDSVGILVGIYSGAALEGVVSHPNERFHLHVIDPSLTRSGHVDDYSVGAGAVLYLPRAR
jgi:hypothetical protein